MTGMSAPVLADLDPEQRLVAEALSGPVLVLAGAGTGKTRAITHRIAHGVLTGRHRARAGMAVTFTNRAAGEMRHRLLGLGVPNLAVRTFHAAALSQLRHFWPQAVGGSFPELVASKARLVDRACRELGIQVSKTTVRDLASEIEWAGSCMVLPGDYPQSAQQLGRSAVGTAAEGLDLPGVARVMAAYAEVKSRAHVLDFEDVLLAAIAMLGDRPDVLDQVQDAYRWFTVDEFQDITPAQERLLALWVGERDDVCVVGDPSQTIYSFAGADPAAFERFVGSWPHATQIRLDRNYRSTPQIVAVANAVNRAGVVAREKRSSAPSVPRPGGVDLTPVVLRAQRGPGPAPAVVTCADDTDEAQTVATRIQALTAEGVSLRDIAVLLRTNAASEKVEVALAQAGIAYSMRGAERFFERPEVREAVVRLRGRLAAGESWSDSATGVPETADADVSAVALGDDSGLPSRGPVTSEVVAVLAGMGWEEGGAPTGGAARERWESLSALVALADEVASGGGASLAAVVGELERRAALSHAPTVDGVTVATLHAAKGLEWPVVFIVGCAEGSLPIVHADTPERVEEERRLFFVGVTRARDRLVVSWALTRNGAGRHREPSRFLAEMRRSSAALTDSATSSGLVRQGRSQSPRERRRRPPSRCRVCGAGLLTPPERTLGRCRTCPGSPDEELAERLRAWRLDTARAREVPAFVVFTDLTLTALAERKPRDQAALLDIPGIGPTKIELYGEALLELVSQAGAD
jgi:DNA helicase-2/ATP-dependent DNA helicase PcrA